MTGAAVIRVLLGVVGCLMLLGGVAIAVTGGAGFGLLLPTVWLIGSGSVLVIVAIMEVSRYRSVAAEAARVPPGPGGGETNAPEARFRPTSEVFLDPTTQRRMRVFADQSTGERRYIAEG